MSNNINFRQGDYGKLLYLLPLIIFIILRLLRDSDSYGYIFELIPLLGRTLPFLFLSIFMVAVYNYRGGNLFEIGLMWPHRDKSKIKMILWIVLSAIAILAMRILVAIALDPLLESFPQSPQKSNPLSGNSTLFVALLPLMWIVVIGEEILIRGFLMNFLAKAFGKTTKGWIFAILISSVIFGLLHMGKGSASMIGSGFGGFVYGFGYFLLRKNLWPVIVAHCGGNTIGFIGAYYGD